MQQKTAQGTSVTLDASPAVGNTLILFIAKPGTSPTTGVSGGGVTWTLDTEVISSLTVFQIWHGHNSNGSSSTVTGNGGGSQKLLLTEWDGLANSAPVVAAGSTAASETLIQLSSVSTPQAVSLVVAGFSVSDFENSGEVADGPTDGFSPLSTVGNSLDCQLHGAVLTATVDDDYSTSWSWGELGISGAPEWAGNICAFAGE